MTGRCRDFPGPAEPVIATSRGWVPLDEPRGHEDEWPAPFGALSGRMPSIEIEDIKAARREALLCDLLTPRQAAERLGGCANTSCG